MHGVALSVMILGTLLAILMNILVMRRVKTQEKEEAEKPSKNTGYINEGMLDDGVNENATSVRSFKM